MNKVTYIAEWAKVDDNYWERHNALKEQLESLKETDYNYKIKFRTGATIAIVLAIAGLVASALMGTRIWVSFVIGASIAIGLLAATLITHQVIDKEQIELNKSNEADQERINEINNQIEELYRTTGDVKYGLALDFADQYLDSIKIYEDYIGTFARGLVKYGRKFDKRNNKYLSESVMFEFNGASIYETKNNEIWKDVFEVPIYHFVQATKKYRKADICVTPFSFTAYQPHKNFKNFDVLRPSESYKRLYPKKMAQLNGEYYPEVSYNSSEIEVFKFFTPRIITYFLDGNGDSIESIHNNTINFDPFSSNYNRYEINDSWRSEEPLNVIKILNNFAITNIVSGIDLKIADRVLENVDALLR